MNTRREELQRLTKDEFIPILNKLNILKFSWLEKEDLINEILYLEVENYSWMNYIVYEERMQILSNMNKKELIPTANKNYILYLLEEEKETIIDIILEMEIEYEDEGFF